MRLFSKSARPGTTSSGCSPAFRGSFSTFDAFFLFCARLAIRLSFAFSKSVPQVARSPVKVRAVTFNPCGSNGFRKAIFCFDYHGIRNQTSHAVSRFNIYVALRYAALTVVAASTRQNTGRQRLAAVPTSRLL